MTPPPPPPKGIYKDRVDHIDLDLDKRLQNKCHATNQIPVKMYDDNKDCYKLETHGACEQLDDKLHRATFAECVVQLGSHYTGNHKIGQGHKLVELEKT